MSAADAASTACAGSAPAVRGESSRSATRSARRPGVSSPASGQPMLRCPSTVSADNEIGRAKPAALLARQPFVHLEGPCLLEHVDQHVLVAAEYHGAPRISQGPGRADAIGKIALRGRAHAHGRAGRAQPDDVLAREMGRVDRSRRRSQRTAVVEQLRGCSGIRGDALLVFTGCSDKWTVQRPFPGGGYDGRQLIARHGAHRVDRRSDPEALAVLEQADPVGPRVRGAIREPLLRRLER